jgi:hypothetical protein
MQQKVIIPDPLLIIALVAGSIIGGAGALAYVAVNAAAKLVRKAAQ